MKLDIGPSLLQCSLNTWDQLAPTTSFLCFLLLFQRPSFLFFLLLFSVPPFFSFSSCLSFLFNSRVPFFSAQKHSFQPKTILSSAQKHFFQPKRFCPNVFQFFSPNVFQFFFSPNVFASVQPLFSSSFFLLYSFLVQPSFFSFSASFFSFF